MFLNSWHGQLTKPPEALTHSPSPQYGAHECDGAFIFVATAKNASIANTDNITKKVLIFSQVEITKISQKITDFILLLLDI